MFCVKQVRPRWVESPIDTIVASFSHPMSQGLECGNLKARGERQSLRRFKFDALFSRPTIGQTSGNPVKS